MDPGGRVDLGGRCGGDLTMESAPIDLVQSALVTALVVAGILVSLGMFMVPPSMVSMPLKLLLFVLADGWTLVAGSILAGVAAVT